MLNVNNLMPSSILFIIWNKSGKICFKHIVPHGLSIDEFIVLPCSHIASVSGRQQWGKTDALCSINADRKQYTIYTLAKLSYLIYGNWEVSAVNYSILAPSLAIFALPLRSGDTAIRFVL